jgi:uncharacterized Zn finger protein (UPF0148 family)
MEFICKRCNVQFSSKPRLKTHLQKNNACEFIEYDFDRDILIDELYQKKLNNKTFDCEYCGTKFNHSSGKSHHKKICKQKPLDKITVLEQTVEKLVSKIDEQQTKIEKLEEQPKNINTTNNTQINNVSLNGIKLRDFGRENMDAIPESLVSSLFCELRFRELLAQLHCDPNFPENQNIRIRSIKRNTMEIFRNNKWDILTFTKGLNELLLQGHKIFSEYCKKDKKRIIEEDMDEDELRDLLNQLDKISKLNKNEIKTFIDDLQMMLEEYKTTGSAIVIL